MAASNTESARLSKEIADRELQFRMAQYDDLAPFLRNQLESGAATAEQQADIADYQFDRGRLNDDFYDQTFRPLEEQMVRDSQEYGSEGDQEREAAKAVAGVRGAYANKRASQQENMRAMGINPASGKFTSADRMMDIAEAGDQANVSNNARTTVKDKGIALRTGAANFGRNMPNTAAAAFNSAVGAGSASTNSAGAGVGNSLAATGMAAGGFGAQQGAMNTQIQANNSNWNMASQAAQMDQAGMQNLGQLAGMGGKLAAQAGWISCRGAKRRGKPVDKQSSLDGVAKVADDTESWEYKPGVADGRRHVGGYADTIRAALGEDTAPGGKMVDPISLVGHQTAAIGALKDNQDELRADVGVLLKKLDRLQAGLGARRA